MALFRLALCVLLVSVAFPSVIQAVDHAEAQVEWLRSKGGFFHDKIQFDLPNGLFAMEDLKRGEMLIIIPRQCLLESEDICVAVDRVMEERELGNKSEFAPYINYLYSTQQGLLPSSWSDAGKELITEIWGKRLLPLSNDLTSMSHKNECDGSGDPLEEHTFMMVHSRCWDGPDETCVPIWDMVNHCTGHYNNADTNSVRQGINGLFVFASRDIEKGEQICYSYHSCTDCAQLDDHKMALPHLFRDYGFVEQYPRRWVLKVHDKKSRTNWLLFDIEEKQKESCDSELELTWVYDEPNLEEVSVLKGHLRRLQDIREDVSRRAERLDSEHERDTSLRFYEALVEALEYAIRPGMEKEAACQNETSADGVCGDGSLSR